MKEITNEEMHNIKGGWISIGVLATIVSGLIFIIGTVDGYTRPKRCNRW